MQTHLLRIYVFLFITFLSFSLLGKNIPLIDTYTKAIHKGGQADRGFAQDSHHDIYIANSEGLLHFNGRDFEFYPLPNKTQVLAIAIDEEDNIFVGGQGELGYFKKNEKGKLIYHSLIENIPESERNFSDIRNINITPKGIFFKSLLRVFHYQNENEEIKVFKTGSILEYMNFAKDTLWLDDKKNGLFYFDDNDFKLASGGEVFNKIEISSVQEFNNSILISSWSNGLFDYKNGEINRWGNTEINSFQIKTTSINPKGGVILGTIGNGIIYLNSSGKIINQISRDDGLRSNAIQALFYDKLGNLWVGLENGLNYLKEGRPFNLIKPSPKEELLGYAVKSFKGKIYLATSNGLYSQEENASFDTSFKLVPNSQGLCWNLSIVDNELFLHQHKGLFKVIDNQIIQVRNNIGSWLIQKYQHQPDLDIEGTYFGLNFYKNGEKIKTIDLQESVRIVEQDGNTIWFSHDYKGAFKLIFDNDLNLISKKLYDSKNGFPSNIDINVSKINNEIIFTTEKGIYKYDSKEDRMIPHQSLNKIFDASSNIKRLAEGKEGKLWFVEGKKAGYINVKDYLSEGEVNKIYLPELEERLVEHFQHIYITENSDVYFGSENGFIKYNNENSIQKDSFFNVMINEVRVGASLDSILHIDFIKNDNSGYIIDHNYNNIQFDFSTNYYSNLDYIQYQSFLEGYNSDWTAWDRINSHTYTNLPAGKYNFHLKAKNTSGFEAEELIFIFEIKAPWYASSLAFLLYVVVLFALIYFFWYSHQQKLKRETESLKIKQEEQLKEQETVFKQRVEVKEREVVQLKNEKLQSEIEFKNRELASSAMHLVQKREVLHKIKEKLNKISKDEDTSEMKRALGKVIRTIDQDLKLDDNWNVFEQYFDQVHTDFVQRLRKKYPQLTPKDYRLCAYLRMNLSSKEIASLLNNTTRSVEVSRYRLRKKLALEQEINLVDFIMDI